MLAPESRAYLLQVAFDLEAKKSEDDRHYPMEWGFALRIGNGPKKDVPRRPEDPGEKKWGDVSLEMKTGVDQLRVQLFSVQPYNDSWSVDFLRVGFRPADDQTAKADENGFFDVATSPLLTSAATAGWLQGVDPGGADDPGVNNKNCRAVGLGDKEFKAVWFNRLTGTLSRPAADPGPRFEFAVHVGVSKPGDKSKRVPMYFKVDPEMETGRGGG